MTIGEFCVSGTHPCLPGHFPGRPVVPAVLILDAVIAAVEARQVGWQVVEVIEAKFLAPLAPEQLVCIEMDETRDASRLRFACLREGVPVARGLLVLESVV
ncbi:MAG: hydroxymyristoyl-ACP dehydratase [Pseudomonadota bacterium]